MVITADATITHDEPIDYAINQFCEKCQVCVNRCPSNALTKDKVWWRGAKKNKVSYKWCRPIMGRYDGCAICMKTCPVQRYGMQPVMEHYVVTGEALGKGTHNLEGYTLKDKGYFGPKENPHFDKGFFEIPRGRKKTASSRNSRSAWPRRARRPMVMPLALRMRSKRRSTRATPKWARSSRDKMGIRPESLRSALR